VPQRESPLYWLGHVLLYDRRFWREKQPRGVFVVVLQHDGELVRVARVRSVSSCGSRRTKSAGASSRTEVPCASQL